VYHEALICSIQTKIHPRTHSRHFLCYSWSFFLGYHHGRSDQSSRNVLDSTNSTFQTVEILQGKIKWYPWQSFFFFQLKIRVENQFPNWKLFQTTLGSLRLVNLRKHFFHNFRGSCHFLLHVRLQPKFSVKFIFSFRLSALAFWLPQIYPRLQSRYPFFDFYMSRKLRFQDVLPHLHVDFQRKRILRRLNHLRFSLRYQFPTKIPRSWIFRMLHSPPIMLDRYPWLLLIVGCMLMQPVEFI